MDLWSLFDFLMPGFLGTERRVCVVPHEFYLVDEHLLFTWLFEYYMVQSMLSVQRWLTL